MSLTNLDIKTLYDEMRFWEQLIEYAEANGKDENTIRVGKEHIIKIKKAIREKNRKEDETKDRRIIKGDWDGYLVKIYCPEWVQTMEDAEEWFDEFERIEMIYYPWDCTGQWFTSWHRIFCVNGKWICYHDVAMDV